MESLEGGRELGDVDWQRVCEDGSRSQQSFRLTAMFYSAFLCKSEALSQMDF